MRDVFEDIISEVYAAEERADLSEETERLRARITELEESESSLIERINEQRRYTGEAVKEVDRLQARNAELETALKEIIDPVYLEIDERRCTCQDGFKQIARKVLEKDHE